MWYHITPCANVPNILRHGLIPCKGSGFVRREDQTCDVIWLTDDVEYIVDTQLTPEWIVDKSPVVLSVDAEDVEPCKVAFCGCGATVEHEFVHHGVITADKISVYSYEVSYAMENRSRAVASTRTA